MKRAAVLGVVLSLFAVPALAKELSYAEKKAIERMNDYLAEAQAWLDKAPLEAFTTKDGAGMVEAKITRAQQEMTRIPASAPDVAAAQERIGKLREAVAARVEEAKALAPGAKKVTESVKAWTARLDEAKAKDPMAFQDPNHRTVQGLATELAGIEKKLAGAGNPEHPDSKEAAAALAEAKAKLQAAQDDAKKAVAALGDWKAKAKELGEKLVGAAELAQPVDDEKLEAWMGTLVESKANLAEAEALLKTVRGAVAGASDTAEYRELADLAWKEDQVIKRNDSYWFNQFVLDIGSAEDQRIDFDKLNSGPDGFDGPRGKIEGGIAAAKNQAKYYRLVKKDEASAATADAKAAELQAKLKELDTTEERLAESIRMPKAGGTPEMQKLMKQILSSADFTRQMKQEGNKLLRAVVVDDRVSKYTARQWYKGRWYNRDWDEFVCVGAFKNATNGKTWKWRFAVRFARAEIPGVKTGAWTYGSWQRLGPILEKHVNK